VDHELESVLKVAPNGALTEPSRLLCTVYGAVDVRASPSRRHDQAVRRLIVEGLYMDRATLKEHLAQAEQLVARGEQRIADQRKLIAELEQGGQDPSQATQLLAQYEELQGMLIVNRDRLADDLARESKRPASLDDGRGHAG
jgi:hypothetical protein